MTNFKCYPQSDPNVVWSYCPTLAPAILFAVLFAIPTGWHIWQGFKFRRPFTLVLVMAGLWEVGGYVARCLSIVDQLNSGTYTAQFLLVLLAPLWINAFIYMILGRMIHYYLEVDKVFGFRARKITLIFVLFDITAFLVQLYGGTKASGTNISKSDAELGLHIYTAGIVVQLVFIAIFGVLAYKFQQQLKRQGRYGSAAPQAYEGVELGMGQSLTSFGKRTFEDAWPLLRAIYIALGIIVLRNIYRLIEYALGVDSTITHHEWYQFVFDAVPMLVAMLILNVWHPGLFLQGDRSDFSAENKARKAAKVQKKADKKASKEMNKNGGQYSHILATSRGSLSD